MLVRGSGIVMKGEEAVIEQDDAVELVPVDVAGALVDCFGEDEARHDIGNGEDPGAEDFADAGFIVGRVSDRQDGVCVGVVDQSGRE